MNTKYIKEQYHRFKQWQEKPYEYKLISDKVNHCNNCGNDFTGNYCPICSQKAGEGPISWGSVQHSFMDIWGLGSRSLPRTIWHLLLRPGHLISDYIDGKLQVSFPPVKMLFIVAVIVVVLIYYLFPLLLGRTLDVYGGISDIYAGFEDWNQSHFAWTYFIMALLFILPTWIMFRYAPRHTCHTLPQEFFIQVFLFVLNLILSFIILLPLLFINYTVYLNICWFVLLVYYVIVYKQLFGYGIWGTLWRVLIVMGSALYILESLIALVFQVDLGHLDPQGVFAGNSRLLYVSLKLGMGVLVLGIGWVINLIATKLTHRGLQNRQTNELA